MFTQNYMKVVSIMLQNIALLYFTILKILLICYTTKAIYLPSYPIANSLAAAYLPVTLWYTCLSISVNKPLAPIRNSVGDNQSLPSSSFIKANQVQESLALRMPPAGLNPIWNQQRYYAGVILWKLPVTTLSTRKYYLNQHLYTRGHGTRHNDITL